MKFAQVYQDRSTGSWTIGFSTVGRSGCAESYTTRPTQAEADQAAEDYNRSTGFAFADELDFKRCLAAHNGTSHVPEERARSEREGYAASLGFVWQTLAKLATTPEKRALLETEFARFRETRREKYNAYLDARSRCISTMIAGGSNFPVARQNKFNAIADRRLAEAGEHQAKAIDVIKKKLCPELAPIMAGDDDAIDRLEAKLAEAEQKQAHMKAVNANIRHYRKRTHNERVAFLAVIVKSNALAEEMLALDEPGYAQFQLTNNRANITRYKNRIAEITKAKATPAVEIVGTKARLEEDPNANRVRLYFDGKPADDVRGRLKSAGFRWTPTLGAWQAYRNPRALDVARAEAGVA